jgi:hypothetical protein
MFAEIGSVNLSMAVHTGLRIIHMLAMALNTDPADIASGQEEPIRRPVRSVADRATLNLQSRMFKDPGTLLLRVTFKADVHIEFIPCPQAGPCPGPVGRVAVRTFHGSVQYPVPGGKRELSPHFLVAGEAKIGLLLFQEVLCPLRSVDLMAVITSHGAQFMDPSSEFKKFLLFLMALETGIGSHYGVFFLEGKNKPASFRLRVFSTRTVAGFTVLFPVRAFLKSFIDVGMTPIARFRSHISFFIFLRFLLAKGCKTDEGYRNRNGNNQHYQMFTLLHTGSPSF